MSELFREVVSLLKAVGTVTAVAAPLAALLWLIRPSHSLLPVQRWRVVTWDGRHCLLAGLTMLIVPYLATAFVPAATVQTWLVGHTVETPTINQLVGLLAKLFALPAVLLLWVVIFSGCGGGPFAQLGASLRPWRRHVVLGIVGFLVWIPVVYAVNLVALVIYGATYGSQPPDHPLLDLLRQQGSAPGIAALIVMESVIAAPVLEELLFRGVMQPLLCRHPLGGSLGFTWAAMIGTLFRSASTKSAGLDHALSLLPPVALVAAIAIVAWWLADLIGRPDPPARLSRLIPFTDAVQRRRAVLGLFGTAALFANVHAAVWPTPVPLFVLGLGLGWLALRTQSVAASVVLHALFNAVACVDMYYLMPAG